MASSSLTEVLRETLALFEGPGEPQTTSEVAARLDLGRRATYERLERLVDCGRLETKKVGGNGRVWWRPPAKRDATPDWAAESLVDDVLDSADVGVFVLDEGFDVAWVNGAAERYFGLDREHVLGRDKRRLVEERVASAVDGGEAFAETVLATYDDNTYTERFECRVTPNGDRDGRWLEHRSKPIETGAYAGGRVELYYDISDRKRVTQARDRDRTRFRSVIDAVEEYAIFTLDSDGAVRTWNRGAERITGYAAEEIVGDHVSAFYTHEAREAGVPGETLAAAAERGSVEDEGWRLRADGSRFRASISVTAIRDDDGEVDGYVNVTRDMTEQRENRQELRRERNLLEQIQEVSPTGIAIFDTDGDVQRANQRFMDLLGRSGADSSEYSLGEQQPLDADGNVVPYPERPAPRALSTGEPVTDQRLRVDGPDGRTRWLSVNARPFEGVVDGVVVTTTDVTQLKTQAQRLERQRDDLQTELDDVFDRIDDGFFAFDEDWRISYLNDRFEQIIGKTEAELVDRNVWDAFPDELDRSYREHYERAMETQEPVTFEEYSDTAEGWLEVTAYPSETGLSVYFRDITERRKRERELERYEKLVESVWDGVYALDEDGGFVLVNQAFCELVGYERDELLGERPALLDGDAVNEAATRLEDSLAGDREAGVFEAELRTADGRAVPVETRLDPFEYGDGHTGRCGVARDVTERKWFEETVLTLYESAQTLFDAETAGAVDEAVVEAVADVIDLPGVAVYRYAAAAEELYPAAHSVEGGFMRGGDLPAVAPDDSSVTGHVYASGEGHVFDDVTGSPYLQSDETEMRGGMFVPMGDHGVLVAGTPAEGGIDDNARRLVELLATNAETAYNRVEREVALRDHERELEKQRESLAALDNLNDVVRNITTAVIEQSTREEIERTVCERLAASESYLFAWVGDVDRASHTVTLRTEAGVEGYLDGVTLTVDPDDERSAGPTGLALRTGEPQVSRDISAESRYDPWREHVEQHGIRSSAAIPIVHEDTTYGVINVYADRPFAFDGQERAVVSQLGEVVGHAIAAAERKQALMSDDLVELEFRVRDVFAALDIPVEPDGPVTLDHAVPVGDGEFLVYGTAAPDAVGTVAEITGNVPHWEAFTVRSGGDPTSFELRMTDPPVLSVVASLGGYIERAVFEDGDYRMTVHLAPSVDARRVTDAVEAAYPTAEMLRRRQVSRDRDDARRVQRRLVADFTARQRTALETAYHAGYFEWPRDASGEDVAEAIGVAPPTFHHHLRKAERKVFDAVFSSPVYGVG
jgi:PAS domain S-box-containing protein